MSDPSSGFVESNILRVKNESSEDFMKKELKKDSSLFSLKEMESSLAKQKILAVHEDTIQKSFNVIEEGFYFLP